MEIYFVRSWRPLAVRGLVAVLLGLIAFLLPSITLLGLVLLFGAYALADGVLAIAAATQHRPQQDAWALGLEGMIGLAIGLAALLWTGMTAVVLVDVIALWAILTGVLEIVAAVRLRREIPGELLLGAAGSVSLTLGVLVLLWPRTSAFVMVTLLGCYALFFGAAMLALAFRLRRLTLRAELSHHGFGPRHGAV